MTRFTVVTLFPEMFESVLAGSLLGRARDNGMLVVDFVDPRDFASDKHRTVDDTPYGGGPGMLMKPEPVVLALEQAAERAAARRIYLSAAGRPLGQAKVEELAALDHVVLLCGRYEGVDQRVVDLHIDEELSLGDFVLTGGELAAMAVIDAVSRYLPGVLGDATSTEEESHASGLLEYPQYTRPPEFRGAVVPEVLVGGHHEKIRAWRRTESLRRTAIRRPDMLAARAFDDLDHQLWPTCDANWAARTYVVLAHHPVVDRENNVVTTAVTNLDLHDLARSTTTYGLGGCVVVTPVTAQRDKVDRILSVWSKERYIDNREQALSAVTTAASIEDALAAIERKHGRAPTVAVTSARHAGKTPIGFEKFAQGRAAAENPTAIVFGTGWGLEQSVIAQSDQLLMPISGRPNFNHLSVRSAVTVTLDRLFGAPGQTGT